MKSLKMSIPEEPKKMRAAVFEEHGGPEKLIYTYVAMPKPAKREVLIKVRACALNHLDLWNLMGMPNLKISMPHILGSDISGEIAELGPKVHGLKIGQQVIASPGVRCRKCEHCKSGWDSLCDQYKITGLQVNGGYAEYVRVPEENVIPVSSKLSYEEWASIPLVFLTAWHMLVTRAKLQKKESVLIHAAGSGVGSAAIKIAKYLGAYVITTVGSDEKIKFAKTLGANEVINYRKNDFSEEVKRITRGKGVDVVVEHIGPETFKGSLTSLKKKGRLVTCGVTSGPTTSLDIRFLFARQLSVIGCYMGGLDELKQVVRLFEKGKLSPVVDKVFPLREAPKALLRMMDRANLGKIILTP